jgi:hypothetical protein
MDRGPGCSVVKGPVFSICLGQCKQAGWEGEGDQLCPMLVPLFNLLTMLSISYYFTNEDSGVQRVLVTYAKSHKA